MKKRANGEGTIYNTVQKNNRKKFLKEMCAVCKNCTQKCNREKFERCDKCLNCKNKFTYCDRFYFYDVSKAQVTIDGERKSAGTGKNPKEAKAKKEEKEKKLNAKTLLKNGNLTLLEAMKLIEKEKLKHKQIKENSYNRNLDTISLIENYNISEIQVCNLTNDMLKNFLSLLVDLNTSQSTLEKVYDEIHQVYKISGNKEEVFEDIDRNTFVSEIEPKDVTAFTIEEEKQLLNYINTHENVLVNPRKCNIDSKTVKNLIKFSLAISTRIGEACSLDKDKDIDMEEKIVNVSKTVTKNLDRKSEIGTTTKTGKKKKKRKQKDLRPIPFGILFDEEEVEAIIKEQSENSINNLLFCQKDGKLIEHSSFNVIFKRICKEAGIAKDCNVHMMKHTCVTRMIENGIDIYVISALVGTSVEVLRKTYAHILDDFVKREIEKSLVKRKETNLTLDTENTIITDDCKCKIIPFRTIAN